MVHVISIRALHIITNCADRSSHMNTSGTVFYGLVPNYVDHVQPSNFPTGGYLNFCLPHSNTLILPITLAEINAHAHVG